MSALSDWWKSFTGQQMSGAEREANAFNQKMMYEEWQHQQEMYEHYESPSAKMNQYAQAGLNPALMYEGAGQGTMPSVAQTDSVSPSENTGNVADMLQTLAGQAIQVAQVKKDFDLASSEQAVATKSGAR